MFDGKAFGDEMAAMVRRYVDTTVAPMAARIETLERELADERARDRVAPEAVARQIAEAVSAIPLAEPVQIDTDALAKLAADAVRADLERAVAALPVPKDGEPGKSVTVEDVRPVVAELVSQAVSAIPVPKDGVGAAGAIIDRDGNLILTLTDGTTRDLGRVVGKDGDNGKDGQQGPAGFSLEDFDSEVRDGGRTLVLSFTAGDIKHTVEHQLDTMIYKQVFKEGETYQPGDTVSFGGGLWHCDAETTSRPGDDAKEWTLAVRRGREGKSVSMEDVSAQIEKRMADIEAVLIKRLDMALGRKGV
jgi:hypothetical protein